MVCLLAFALLASGYVLSVTWNDPKRNKAKLLLNCSMIVASVVPPGMHTSAYVSIRQHTSAYVSIRQHTYAVAQLLYDSRLSSAPEYAYAC